MDTGALKKAQPETIRILVWLLSFLGFGYATAEFEVTSERLGVYRPEEHIEYARSLALRVSKSDLGLAIRRITTITKMRGNMMLASVAQFAILSSKSTCKLG